MSDIRVRFAPSPTGSLHVGGARTAIYNWAYARRQGGKLILRIEDTDPERSTPENTEQIIRSLRWLGLEWDEGPDIGGGYAPYLQTQRFDSYTAWLEKLKSNDNAYPCFCTAAELKERREAANAATAAGPSGYDRRCRSIGASDAAARIANGEQHTWRLKLPLERGPVVYHDGVYGEISTPYPQMDDLILVRSDGSPTYNYACVIDDIEMDISHVIRGDDHISNTPKQILIYEALGVKPPAFAHLSMILGADGSRLSKRHGATSIEAYRDAGYLPEALMNYLALLGWSLDGQTTLIDAETLCQNFSLERVSRNPAVFDSAKLDWMNAAYIKQMGARAFIDALSPYLQNAGYARLFPMTIDQSKATDGIASPEAVAASIADNRDWYEAIYPLIAERIKTLGESIPSIAYLFEGPTLDLDETSVEKCLQTDGVATALDATIALLSDGQLDWNHQTLETALRALPDELGVKTKTLFQAIRVATCGNMVSPPLFESLELLGRDTCLARLRTARILAL